MENPECSISGLRPVIYGFGLTLAHPLLEAFIQRQISSRTIATVYGTIACALGMQGVIEGLSASELNFDSRALLALNVTQGVLGSFLVIVSIYNEYSTPVIAQPHFSEDTRGNIMPDHERYVGGELPQATEVTSEESLS